MLVSWRVAGVWNGEQEFGVSKIYLKSLHTGELRSYLIGSAAHFRFRRHLAYAIRIKSLDIR